jgi:hypothetical protein
VVSSSAGLGPEPIVRVNYRPVLSSGARLNVGRLSLNLNLAISRKGDCLLYETMTQGDTSLCDYVKPQYLISPAGT